MLSPAPTASPDLSFGPEYLIPRPFDPRLIVRQCTGGRPRGNGLRRRDATDCHFDVYIEKLQQFVFHSGTMMKPIVSLAATHRAEAQAHHLCRRRGGAYVLRAAASTGG